MLVKIEQKTEVPEYEILIKLTCFKIKKKLTWKIGIRKNADTMRLHPSLLSIRKEAQILFNIQYLMLQKSL